ncbi:hypothetical protein BJ878DRAFT_537602 [Calycina marina]|uniref:N-acetyltransferase domain-containing protein n=1 Tax=Calycina marina TaxID=1763456 RepID=A0A9P7ZC03_9HELO|nr:hypothetical protein BJ878DRAFT_537602 [Calycina marina]
MASSHQLYPKTSKLSAPAIKTYSRRRVSEPLRKKRSLEKVSQNCDRTASLGSIKRQKLRESSEVNETLLDSQPDELFTVLATPGSHSAAPDKQPQPAAIPIIKLRDVAIAKNSICQYLMSAPKLQSSISPIASSVPSPHTKSLETCDGSQQGLTLTPPSSPPFPGARSPFIFKTRPKGTRRRLTTRSTIFNKMSSWHSVSGLSSIEHDYRTNTPVDKNVERHTDDALRLTAKSTTQKQMSSLYSVSNLSSIMHDGRANTPADEESERHAEDTLRTGTSQGAVMFTACELCKKEYESEGSLDEHRSSCRLENKTFTQKSVKNYHQTTLSSSRPTVQICGSCGMIYNTTLPEDKLAHKKIHRLRTQGHRPQHDTSKALIGRDDNVGLELFKVTLHSPKEWQLYAEDALKASYDNGLGGPGIDEFISSLWLACGADNKGRLIPRDIVYFLTIKREFAAVAVVDRSDNLTGSHCYNGPIMYTDRGPIDIGATQPPAGTQEWANMDSARSTKICIDRLWVHPDHQRKGWATKLINVVRSSCMDEEIKKHEVCISKPTELGILFFTSYFGDCTEIGTCFDRDGVESRVNYLVNPDAIPAHIRGGRLVDDDQFRVASDTDHRDLAYHDSIYTDETA